MAARFGSRVLWSVAVGAALIGGCKEDDTNKTTPTPTPTPAPVPAPTATTMPSVDDAADAAAGATEGAAGAAAGATEDATAAAGAMTADASATMSAEAKEAQGHITEAMNYIKENKLDLAEEALNKAEAMKDKLPKVVQDNLQNARTMLDAAKAKSGAMPDVGGMKVPGAEDATK